MKTAILGASPKPDRYAHMAQVLLSDKGHEVVPVNPGYEDIEGVPTVGALSDLESGTIHTVTVYMGEKRTADLAEQFTALKPKRVIFNPGAENPHLAQTLSDAGIEVVEACTLVMLRTNQY